MTWNPDERARFACFVAARTGLCLERRWDGAEAGARRAMARARVSRLDDYLQLLGTDPDALDALVEELTVGETYFFREPAQFDWLRAHALPAWRRAGAGRPLRAWSAGCASGEEAYSLALLFEQEGFGDHACLLATDISRAALVRARRGVYGRWSLREPGGRLMAPYLHEHGGRYCVRETLRRRIVFAPLNLAQDDYTAAGAWGLDLILCRNVLIYFDPATVARVARNLFAALADGGWLLTAAADPVLTEYAPFETTLTEGGLVYRRPRAEAPRALEPVQDRVPAALALAANAAVPRPTQDTEEDPKAIAQRLRALANTPGGAAERACAAALECHPLSAELHFLHAALLLEQGRPEAAIAALRRVLYLDRAAAAAHFCLGSVLARHGDGAGARRAFRTVRDLCVTRPAEEAVPLGEGETWGQLGRAAAGQLARLERHRG